MRTSTRLISFGLALVVVFAVGAGVGALVGPDVTPPESEAPAPVGEGVVAAADGYRLVPASPNLSPEGGSFRFTVVDQYGEAVREYTEIHERDLHLIVVNRELTAFHHVHPQLGPDGTWWIDLPALAPGSYRAVADFQIADGPRLALGADLAVAGAYQPTRLGEPSPVSTVDGYEVALETERGEGAEVIATLTVRREGQLVDLEPYLGAYGHLVAMRVGDLSYAHVHPVEDEDDKARPGVVRFDATLASAGQYGLFFDFKHDATVRTASFTFDQGAVTGVSDQGH